MSLFALLQTGCLIAFALLLLLAAWQDLRTLQIADAVSLGIVGVFVVWALGGWVLGTLPSAWRWPARPLYLPPAPWPSLPARWAAVM